MTSVAERAEKIIFFNEPMDVDLYMRVRGMGGREDALCIATRPSVGAYAQDKGVVARDTLAYFDGDSHRRMLDCSKEITAWLWDAVEFAGRERGVEEAYREAFVFFTRLAVHYCIWAVEVASNVCALHMPGALAASAAPRRSVAGPYIEPEERVFGRVARSVAAAKGIVFDDIAEQADGALACRPSAGGRIDLFVLKSAGFWCWSVATAVKHRLQGRRPVCFTTRHYNMARLAKEVDGLYPRIGSCIMDWQSIPQFKVPDILITLMCGKGARAIRSQRERLRRLVAQIRQEATLFSYRGVSIADEVAEKVERNIIDQVLGLYIWTPALDRFLSLVRPVAIVSNGNRLDDVLLAELAAGHKIKSIMVSHGSFTMPKSDHERIEWGDHGRHLLCAPFSSVALQSPLSEEYLRVFPPRGRAVKTGPLIWGMPVDRGNSEKSFRMLFGEDRSRREIRVITHAGTPKMNKGFRAYVYETPDEYIKAIRDLAEAVNNMADTALIVRFRPTSEITIESLRAKVPFSEKVILSDSGSFSDVLGITDLLVSFSSTTIEEALQNRVPVLLYGGEGRYQHVPASEVLPGRNVTPSAVYHIRDAAGLAEGLSNILRLAVPQGSFDPYIYPEEARSSMAELLGV